MISQEELKAHLMETNEEFRSLALKHAEYEQQIAAIESKGFVTPEEEVEEHRLKKLKLQLKDRMLEIMSQYKTRQAS